MSHCIAVGLGARSYDVLIESGLLDSLADRLRPLARGDRLAIISDENVWRAQGERLSNLLRRGGIEPQAILVPAGDRSKSWEGLAWVTDRLLDLRLERSDHVVAFGGGMIGDLTGLAAALLKRGCGFVQIPTSLLAQVDSSVGGKTGINTRAGKNLVGVFHQPSLVLIDPDILDTLPERELRAGFAEVVKYGLIGDAGFFDWCEAQGPALIAGDPAARLHAIATSVRAKAEIVAADERETSGRRALLNLGHTFGHALEAETGYSERLLHGEAVAIGMALAFRFAASLGRCPADDARRVEACLGRVGLPSSLSQSGTEADGARLVDHMKQDKKASDGIVPFILPNRIGEAVLVRDVALDQVVAFLDAKRDAESSRPLPASA